MTAKSYVAVQGASDRLRVGVIGCGGMATHHMKKLVAMKDTDNVDVIGVCDVYDKRLDAAAALTGGKKDKKYQDLLANKDIDYVLIGATEHWHFQMTMDAADAGKHIYCEKPMTLTMEAKTRPPSVISNTPTSTPNRLLIMLKRARPKTKAMAIPTTPRNKAVDEP